MEYTGVYTVRYAGTVAAIKTMIQLKAASGKSFDIIKATLTQSTVTSAAQTRAQILRKSAAATVTAFVAGDIKKHNSSYPTNACLDVGTAASGYNASAEGTDGDVVVDEGLSILSGWLYYPLPEDRITVQAAEIVGLKLPEAPTSATWIATITIGER